MFDPANNKVQIRENKERDIYPECSIEQAKSAEEILTLIQRGTKNRHIACTNMNRESSRSHAVFSAIIKQTFIKNSKTPLNSSGVQKLTKTSRFHIVDLAGSERCKETGAEGLRLKEASMINKSLTTLG